MGSIFEEPEDEEVDLTVSTREVIDAELLTYRKEPKLTDHLSPLMWWKNNVVKYPNLSGLARYYLGIMASSVPSERVFSKAGEIISAKRSRLDEDHVNQLIFLNGNI